MDELRILVGFDTQNNGFVFEGMDLTPEGMRLDVPYSTEPVAIRFMKNVSEADWSFHTISFRGPTGTELSLVNAWRSVYIEESPVKVVDSPTTMVLEVKSFTPDEIVIHDTNLATQIEIGIRIQLTIEDHLGRRWTSPDPQVINKKEEGGFDGSSSG